MSSSGFAALCSAFGRYDVVHIHAEGPAFFAWLPKLLGKRVVVTIHGIDWQREKWQSGLGSKFIHQGEKNAAKYADEVIVLSKGVQDCPNHQLKNPITHENCEKCLGGHFVNCMKGKCIHGSTAKSAIGMMEAEFWKWNGAYIYLKMVCWHIFSQRLQSSAVRLCSRYVPSGS